MMKPGCTLSLDFSQEEEIRQWWPVLDGVMGGKSSGNRFAEDGHMTFKGTINTDGGGFSSLRRAMWPGDMAGAEVLNLGIKQDGRAYKLTFRTSASIWGRPISYQVPIPQTSEGVWTDVTIPLTDFRTSIFGRGVAAPPFNPAAVREIGVILADGIDGPFEIHLASIACAKAP